MANVFSRKLSNNIGTSNVVIGSYTIGASAVAVVIGLSLSNRSSNSINASVYLSTNANANVFVIKDAPIPQGGALVAVGGDQKIVMSEGDKIVASSSENDSLDAIMSVLEITP